MNELLARPEVLGWVVLRTLAVYACILAGFRLSGKHEVGQMSPFDFALILLVANAVQNAMVGPDTSLLGGLVAAFVLFGANAVLARLAARHPKLDRKLRGSPRILVNRGQVDSRALSEEHVSHDELMQALREGECPSIADCRLAVLEVDGHISVILNERGKL